MRLTKEMKETFVVSVMADVPKINYGQQIDDAVLAHFIDKMPPTVKRIWDSGELRSWINTNTAYDGVNRYIRVPTNEDISYRYPLSENIKQLQDAAKRQEETRKQLRCKLMGVAMACTTLKQLKDTLPEFVKYMPAEGTPNRSVPAIANVVADFVKAGWPDKKQQKGEK